MIIRVLQLLCGIGSFYCLLNEAITLGLTLMFCVYIVGFWGGLVETAVKNKTKH